MENKDPYYDENGSEYWNICPDCGKYRDYVGWTKYDNSKMCHCDEEADDKAIEKMKPRYKYIDITEKVDFENNDDECLPLTKCVCGEKFKAWDFLVGIYDDPELINQCPHCGRGYIFRNEIRVYQVLPSLIGAESLLKSSNNKNE